ncbi:hypothetical protein [Paenibacillus campi]|uniref:hypothetical protein n=1 Tax=Paenibacillus campi TaxID=3106031 RepID=UPI002AFDE7C8|nr:hypothetical protein [Paenibacillus sp. SGZ-1009]
MKKTKWLFPMMLAGMILAGSSGVYAGVKLERIEAFKNYGIRVELNGQTYTPMNADGQPLAPITYEGSTYLPIRAIGETMNTSVLYDAVNNRVLIGKAGTASTTNAAIPTKDTTSTTPAATQNATSTAPVATKDTATANAATGSTTTGSGSTTAAVTSPPAQSSKTATSDSTNTPSASAAVAATPGPIDTLNDPTPPPIANIGMTTGVIQSSYLSADFPFPADAERVRMMELVVGGKKQLSLVYRTQADLAMIGNAYIDYYTGYNMQFGAKQSTSSSISIVGIVNDAFGVSIQGNPMSQRPGYNSVSIILAEQ